MCKSILISLTAFPLFFVISTGQDGSLNRQAPTTSYRQQTAKNQNRVAVARQEQKKACTPSIVDLQIKRLSSPVDRVRKIASKSLVEGASKCANRKETIRTITRELASLCSRYDATALSSSYRTFREITEIISRLRHYQAIGMLVGCVNQTSVHTGLSMSYFPAQMVLVKFGNRAVPGIEKGLMNGSEEIKCPLVSVLIEIGSERAKNALEKALRAKPDPDTETCMRKGLEVFNSAERKTLL